MDTLIPPQELARHLEDPGWRIVDCRFALADPAAGEQSYRAGHIRGAHFADLERHLSGTVVRGVTGRHPLPDPTRFLACVRQWGIAPDTRVIAYDEAGGAFAARLWWLLRWIGHAGVGILDGGWNAWCAAGLPTSQELPPAPPASSLSLRPALTRTITSAELADAVAHRRLLLLDARDGARFRGEVEPIDPVAGHIPGARSAPFLENLNADATFRSRGELAARFAALVPDDRRNDVVCYCGSGVTAAHNIAAMVHAGMPEPMLYAGSWSEWIVDPGRPIETGG